MNFKKLFNLHLSKTKITAFVLIHFTVGFFGSTNLYAQNSTEEFIQSNDTLVVYKDVPGLLPSDKYTIRVRSIATNNEWVNVFAHYTYNRGFELADIAREDGSFLIPVVQGYQKHTNRWSHTFGNIEMTDGQSVEIEIAAKNGLKIGGLDFFKATVHPAQKASLATIVDGKVYFTINNPAQVVIDINGQMDDYNAAINGGIGHPIHAVSLFANPIIIKPSLSDTRVKLIETGTDLLTINSIDPSSYDTMYFKPGIHDIGSGIKIHPGKNIYIPGDALVYGTFDNKDVPKGSFSRSGENITIFGYGTISGQKIPHYQYAYNYPSINVTTDRVITIDDAINYKLYGITTIDNANHTTSIFSYGGGSIKWWKTITWRANGDGIGDYGDVEDCFIRTADDCSYVKGNRRRCTFWKDANAALFHMATIPENRTTPIYIEDCDFLYSRLRTAVAFNGGGFQQRGEGAIGQRNVNVVARNLRFHDKLINMRIFALDSGTNGSSFDGILFQNISIAGMAPGNKQMISGSAQSPWYGGIIFDNLTIGGTLVTPENHTQFFNTNEFVKDIWYRMPNYYAITKNSISLQGSISVNTTDTTQFAIRTAENSYLEKSIVSISAQALPGYKFSSWSGDILSTDNPVLLEMNSNKSIKANFEYIGFKTLTVNPASNGTVVVTPTGASFSFNSTVNLTAKPAIGFKFVGWSGDLTNQDIMSSILMDADKTVTPIFEKTNDFAINYGGDQYVASDGTVYIAGLTQSGTTETTSNTITNTTDPVLYKSGKWSSSLSYSYPVDNGQYEVVMKFAELSNPSASVRRFNILLEGTTVLSNFHISGEAGGNFVAIDRTFQTTVADGSLNINLSRVSTATNNAKISAISIKRVAEVTPLFSQFPQYCYGETIPALPTTSSNGITGTWSPAINNSATTIYTFTPTQGLYAVSTTMTIIVNSNVIPIFNPVAPICSGDPLSELPTTSTNGISGTWSPSFVDRSKTTEYTFTPIAGLCASSTNLIIIVNQCSQTFCKGATVATATGNTGIKFYSTLTGGLPLAGTTALSNARTYFVSEMINNVESSPRVARTIFVNVIPATPASMITTDAVLCKYVGTTNTVTYTVVTVATATSYLWSVPAGANVIEDGNATDNEITLNFLNAPINNITVGGLGTISARAVNPEGCPSLPKSLVLTAKLPTAPASLTMTSTDSTDHFNYRNPTTLSFTLEGLDVLSKITKVGPYVGTQTVFTLTAPVAPTAASYEWTLPLGATQLSGTTTSKITVEFAGVPAGIGSLPILVKSVGGCGKSSVRTLTLSRTVPGSPTALTLTNSSQPYLSSLSKITKVGPYTGTNTRFTLTATPFLTQGATSTSYAWILPTGVTCETTSTPTTVFQRVAVPTTIENPTGFEIQSFDAIETPTNIITVNFLAATGTGNLELKVFGLNGAGNSIARKLVLARALPTAPTALVLRDGATVVNRVGPYVGKSTSLTLTATPYLTQGAEATSFTWTLPAGVNVTSGATLVSGTISTPTTWTSTGTVLTIDFEGVAPSIFTLPLSVQAVNGAGTSASTRTLTVISAAPTMPGSITTPTLAIPTYNPACPGTTTITVQVPSVFGVTYTWTVGAGASITAGQGTNSITIDVEAVTTTTLAISVIGSNGTGSSGTRALSIKKVGTCREASSAIANEFSVMAYPNPSSSEFTIKSSAKGAMNVKVYDMAGRLVEKADTNKVGSKLAAGTYNVIVNQGANTKSVRVIKK